jgi:hypothetical protein
MKREEKKRRSWGYEGFEREREWGKGEEHTRRYVYGEPRCDE